MFKLEECKALRLFKDKGRILWNSFIRQLALTAFVLRVRHLVSPIRLNKLHISLGDWVLLELMVNACFVMQKASGRLKAGLSKALSINWLLLKLEGLYASCAVLWSVTNVGSVVWYSGSAPWLHSLRTHIRSREAHLAFPKSLP